jgi:hypothetical protein
LGALPSTAYFAVPFRVVSCAKRVKIQAFVASSLLLQYYPKKSLMRNA